MEVGSGNAEVGKGRAVIGCGKVEIGKRRGARNQYKEVDGGR